MIKPMAASDKHSDDDQEAVASQNEKTEKREVSTTSKLDVTSGKKRFL